MMMKGCCFLLALLLATSAKADHAMPDYSMPVYRATLAQIGTSGVTGDVIIFVEKGQSMFGAGAASGLEANLNDKTNCTAKNGCGVHVHKGKGCASAQEQGGHYFKGSTDPWAAIRYQKSSAAGKANFDFIVNDAGTDIEGRAFVVHNNAGGRVACGVLKKHTTKIGNSGHDHAASGSARSVKFSATIVLLLSFVYTVLSM